MGKQARAPPSPRVRFAALALGVLIMHTLVTILEERLFNIDTFRNSSGGAFMTLFMYSFTVFAYLPRVRNSGLPLPPGTRRTLALVSTLYVGTTTLTKTSLRYIDMPTQTVLKSAKLLPVMVGSIAILGKRYSLREWLAAVMLCAGIAVFNLSTHFAAFSSTLAGGVCIGIALMCDALLGNYQQKVLSSGVTTDQLMLVQSAVGSAFMLVVTLADGTLWPGLDLLLHDVEVSCTLVAWAIAITAGTSLVLKLVAEYSAVIAIVVTTARKALTLIASFVLFPKHIGWGHPVGAALVFGSAFVVQSAKRSKSHRAEAIASERASGHLDVSERSIPGSGAPSAGRSCANVV